MVDAIMTVARLVLQRNRRTIDGGKSKVIPFCGIRPGDTTMGQVIGHPKSNRLFCPSDILTAKHSKIQD